jgi:hypothetical protein
MPFPAGGSLPPGGPLSRFLPPLPTGLVGAWLEDQPAGQGLLLDPFGSSPGLAAEAAGHGRAVLVTATNPVTRFVIEHTLQRFALEELQGALAQLSSLPKNGGRLEPFLIELYRSRCTHCGARVVVEYFIWDRESGEPVLKAYACPNCNHTGEALTDQEDRRQALAFEHHGLQTARALEQVAPSGDPDREHAEAALAVYPGRALYALMAVINKLDQVPWKVGQRAAADALLLSALDSGNALWGVPEGRPRPRQLIASPRFREINVWRALEKAVDGWASLSWNAPWSPWREGVPPAPGRVLVASQSSRQVLADRPLGEVEQLMTVFPRPNQAYWTLCALWAAWLWGKEAAAPIKVALRRRRYDWGWHAAALRVAVAGMASHLKHGLRALGIVIEAEAGFVGATLSAMDAAGFTLERRALRLEDSIALFEWHFDEQVMTTGVPDLKRQIRTAAAQTLQDRCEPGPYLLLYTGVLCELAGSGRLRPLWATDEGHPLGMVADAFESVLAGREFIHLGGGSEPESGQYWLSAHAGEQGVPLSDRLEEIVVQNLQGHSQLATMELEREIYRRLPGLQTPDRRMIAACLSSYAIREPGHGLWQIRQEDEQERRQQDVSEIRKLLAEMGLRLGFAVESNGTTIWRQPDHSPAYTFVISERAALGAAAACSPEAHAWLVIPGSRAILVEEKARRNPLWARLLESPQRVLKFRHVRRLAVEGNLTAVTLADRLPLDPPEHQDPQLPLL